jgi:hypothetical protein
MNRTLITRWGLFLFLLVGCNTTVWAEAPSLPGTNWQLLSLTDKGQPIKDAQNPADVEFLKDGTWGILHYGGRREAGKYRVQGERLIMLTDDGETYNDARMIWKPAEQVLELDSGTDLMRLRVQEKSKH